MFKSELTGKQFGKYVSPVVIVTHKRKKTYFRKDKYGNDRECGQGWEIVKEIRVAPSEVEAARAKFGDGVFVE